MSVDDKERNAVLLAQAYLDYYKTQRFPWATIAVVKTDEMELLAAVTRSIMQENMENIASFTPSMLSLFQNRYGYGRGELSRSSYDFRAFVSEVTGGNIPLAFEGQLGKTVIFEGYVNDYPLVNIDEDMYSGIGCYIPYKSFTKWNAYFRFSSVRLNRLRNKLLANYLKSGGNELATVRISAFCVAMLSNNSFICKYSIFFRKYELSAAVL